MYLNSVPLWQLAPHNATVVYRLSLTSQLMHHLVVPTFASSHLLIHTSYGTLSSGVPIPWDIPG